MESYRTVSAASESRFEEKKSIFISSVKPCGEFAEAEEFCREIRAKYPDANHHVWAFISRTGSCVRFDDDSEPKGTAGMPALEVLKKEELSGICVVITRYFGGILLGAGGLARAYARGARDAVAAAGICTFCKMDRAKVRIDYTNLAKFEYELRRRELRILQKEFTEGIDFLLLCTPAEREKLDEFLLDLSGGRIRTELDGYEFARCEKTE